MPLKRRDVSLPVLCLAAGLVFAQNTPQSEPLPESANQVAPHTEKQPDSAAPPPPRLTSDQIRDLIRDIAEKDIENDKRQRDYSYIERVEEHKLNGKGDIASTETAPTTSCESTTSSAGA